MKKVLAVLVCALLLVLPMQVLASTTDVLLLNGSGSASEESLIEFTETDDGEISPYDIQRKYWKVLYPVLWSGGQWPFTMYYTEKNPYGTGNASGTLEVVGAEWNSNAGLWYLTYEGYLYYYETV